MERVHVKNLKEHVGEQVTLKGFVHEVRDQSKIKFILVRDVTGIAQTVVPQNKETLFEEMPKINRESVVEIQGTVKEVKVAPNGVEVEVDSYKVLSEAETPLPIPVVEKTSDEVDLSKRLAWRWIDLRKTNKLLIFKIWTTMERAMREYWENNGFLEIHSPKLMGVPSESGAELFKLKYFDKGEAYLAQSPQFYKQMAMAAGFEKVFEIAPVFRANPSHTSRHDTEFTMTDMEISYIESHEDVMKEEENWLQYVISRVKEKHGEEIKETFDVDIEVPEVPFPRYTMDEVQEILKERGYKGAKDDLDSEGEKMIAEYVKEKYGHDFVFVTHYPWSARPFYHMKDENNPELTKSYDLIWNGTEITTGAQREHRHDVLEKQAKEKNLHLEPLEDYLNFFRYGCPPHGGFGFSPSRMLMLLLNINNVREVTFLPRDTERIRP